jgi:hypothetical protein
VCLLKSLSADEKQYYEREADKHNGMNPVKDDEVDEEEEEVKRQHHHMAHPYATMHQHTGDMHSPGGMHTPMHQVAQHDPRHVAYPYATHMYGQAPYGHYDYTLQQQQHQQQHSTRHGQGRGHGYGHGSTPPGRYDG